MKKIRSTTTRMPAEVHWLVSNQGINVVIGSSMAISVRGKEIALDWPNSGELSSYNRTLFYST
ncbi:hypothetical protein [Lysinibacillus fusiformis]|uniref:hypothetical protein n=1 Tax=Lysinibacillus fusiformis TaxID=28031 RepID=UPI001ABF9382|nr:hypothetical protein [Lysinibacillus fusiformis]